MQNLPPSSWLDLLSEERQVRLMQIQQRVSEEEESGLSILPPLADRYAALNALQPEDVRVVIVGQDPYPTPGNAHGLAFSVRPGTPIPASLRNIFKEIESDIGRPSICAKDGYLMPWEEQGVLLLNTTLTVRSGEAGSHERLGWIDITSAWIAALGKLKPGIVFLLWGNHAQRLAVFIPDAPNILTTVHPSPLSARRGFFGCRHFSKTNRVLLEAGESEISW